MGHPGRFWPRQLAHKLSQPHVSCVGWLGPACGLPESLIGLCVGIEDPTDLIEDVSEASLEAVVPVMDLFTASRVPGSYDG